ncbi:hypothetical protein L596_029466 [Steinernema carpocapsae]|uniref:Uncharacterized protein n=1 Tax=Steinernema carpocapsae TaxID=34508 RepID=A0A4U5LUR2_STECR|nr:hypothetical protein L596_029466 [Steinernema carpocapsae]
MPKRGSEVLGMRPGVSNFRKTNISEKRKMPSAEMPSFKVAKCTKEKRFYPNHPLPNTINTRIYPPATL